MTYTAFLRGINVGGHKKVPMKDLKEVLEKSGYTNVRTLLNSGNVIFDSTNKNTDSLKQDIETLIEKKFGIPVPTIVRTQHHLKTIVKSNPFKDITVTKDTRLYITFLAKHPDTGLKNPFTSKNKSFKILTSTDTEVISVLDLSKGKGTTDAMKMLEKEYGKDITTRNYNTVKKTAE